MDYILCPYCGCGCRLKVQRDGDKNSGNQPGSKIEKILPDAGDPQSQGKPCVKGLMVKEMLETNRLTQPMIRQNKDEELEPCTWDEAFAHIKKRLDKIIERSEKALAGSPVSGGPASIRNKIYFLGSGEFSNETNYLFSKLCRSHFGSNNIDSCARLCHAATGAAFHRSFGIKAIPKYSLDDLESGDLFFFVGTDPLEDYPVLFNRVLDAKKRGAKIVCVDVAPSGTTGQADHFYRISPDGIMPLLADLITRLVDGGDISRDARLTEGFEGFLETARKISEQNPPSTFSLSNEEMKELYWLINDAKRPVIGFGMGLTQHENGTQNVLAITGLSMLLDAVLFPNRGKVNVQGCSDVGADPEWSEDLNVVGSFVGKPAGLSSLAGSQAGFRLGEFGWSSKFLTHEGRYVTEALYEDEVEFVWVMGGNPSQSLPDLNALDKSFEKKFIVYQHHHLGRTMEFADVVLPVTVLSEEYGSVTNGERRVRGVAGIGPSAIANARSVSPDRKRTIGKGIKSKKGKGNTMDGEDRQNIKRNVDLLIEFAKFIGADGFDFESVEEIFIEMVNVVPGYGDLDLSLVYSDDGQLAQKTPRWQRFSRLKYERRHFTKVNGYDFVLTTARNRYHFCTGDGTRNSPTLSKMAGKPVVLMNPMDAESLGITNGGVVKLKSEVGKIDVHIKPEAGVEKRVIVAPFHFEKLLVNRLTPRALDPDSGTPCYKEVRVAVEM